MQSIVEPASRPRRVLTSLQPLSQTRAPLRTLSQMPLLPEAKTNSWPLMTAQATRVQPAGRPLEGIALKPLHAAPAAWLASHTWLPDRAATTTTLPAVVAAMSPTADVGGAQGHWLLAFPVADHGGRVVPDDSVGQGEDEEPAGQAGGGQRTDRRRLHRR